MKRITKDFTFTEYLVSELSGTDKVLYQKALDASGRAYAPYSRFQVGAAALLENGEVITGCNQENAAYPSGLCAERVALFGAGAACFRSRIHIALSAADILCSGFSAV